VPYAVGKGGLAAMTKVLAMEYGDHGIRINMVSPAGTTISDRVTSRLQISAGVIATEDDPEEAETYRREMRNDIQNQQAIKRPGLPEEQAAAIAFLASGDDAFITGQVIIPILYINIINKQ